MEQEFFDVITDVNTGEQTIRPWTQEEIDTALLQRRKMLVPESITRRQCAMMMFSTQMITGPEAVAMTQSGIPPAAVQAYLDTMPEPDRTMAIMDFAASSYYRENPLLLALMIANNMTEEDVDNFFIAAGKL